MSCDMAGSEKHFFSTLKYLQKLEPTCCFRKFSCFMYFLAILAVFLVLFQFDTCVLADDVMKRMVFMILTNDFASNIGCYMCLSRLSSVFVKVVPFIC